MRISYTKSWDSDGTCYTQTLRMSRREVVDWNSRIWEEAQCNYPFKQHYAFTPDVRFLHILPQNRSIKVVFLNLTQLYFIKFFANNSRILDRNTRLIIE